MPLDDFTDGLRTVAAQVVRCRLDRESGPVVCTGWLLTGQLVVIPAHTGSERGANMLPQPGFGSKWTVMFGGTDARSAIVVFEPSPTNGAGVTLLRLTDPFTSPARPLQLSMTTPRGGQRIAIPHYVGGVGGLRLSFGTVIKVEGARLLHDAATALGAGGAPVLDLLTLQVIGMHFAATRALEIAYSGIAYTTATLLDGLQVADGFWADISSAHGLAHATSIRRMEADIDSVVPADEVLRAAVRWSFDPEDVTPDIRALLRPMTVDPSATKWHLTGDSRRRLLARARSVAQLRQLRGTDSVSEPGQRAIDRALDGPPFPLSDISDSEMPYWLQVTRWFEGVIDKLPPATDVARELNRRRLRSPLRRMAGRNFIGRTRELAALKTWYEDARGSVMSVHGIGGIGKSALIAQFALGLPDEAALFWLDFDRADLASDDKESVVAVLVEQAAVQFDGFYVTAQRDETWQDGLRRIALALNVSDAPPPLIVLDGFEIAMHADRHAELWTVLSTLTALVAKVKILVSGRAPIQTPILDGRPNLSTELTALRPADASAVLRTQGMTDARLIDYVLRSSRGIPLFLVLALRLWRSGGDVRLPSDLPGALVDGYLALHD